MLSRRNKGFTLIELSIVLAIIGVMAVIGFPTFSGWIARARLRDAARTVYSDMQLARIRAIETGGNWKIEFDPDNGNYTVLNPGPDMVLDTDDDITEKVVTIISDNPGVSFGIGDGISGLTDADASDGVTFYPNNDVEFEPEGRANRGGTVYLRNERHETFAIVLSFNLARVRMARNYGGGWEE